MSLRMRLLVIWETELSLLARREIRKFGAAVPSLAAGFYTQRILKNPGFCATLIQRGQQLDASRSVA
ncbi:MAG: hypothetical protein ACYC92_10975 [Candidatus Acidiferrales bacterium]